MDRAVNKQEVLYDDNEESNKVQLEEEYISR